MKIWITGGAGFLGQRLTAELAQQGHHVLSLSRRPSTVANESVAIDLAQEKDKLNSVASEHGPADVVVHAASRQPGRYTFPEFVKGNILPTVNLLEALKSSPPKQIIFTSTLSVYAQSNNLPFAEDHPASSALAYAATKRWAEQLLETFRAAQVTVLRLPSLYGAGQGDSFIDGLAQLALRGEVIELFSRGTVIREALHVSDVIRAIQSCIDQPPAEQFCLMNLGTGRKIATLEYAEALVEALGSKSPVVLSDRAALQFDCYADIQRARDVIGFEPTELKESLRRYTHELRA
ncbi:MAG TPA: NAD(P)-dependent oxidoreductase [Pyrinomonadaceae bacterium]|nr:NAD(P)-dependent oxidoreductase [Pyrinomonadaceae bacterium]